MKSALYFDVCGIWSKVRPEQQVLPVLNILHRDYRLRTEVTHLFSKYSISEDLLTFRDEVDLSKLVLDSTLEVTLVDHNVLSPKDSILDEHIVEIVDHRPQEVKSREG